MYRNLDKQIKLDNFKRQSVIDLFENNFAKFVDMPIVIYGIGKNTQYIIEGCKKYNIIGLMDEVRTGDIVYDKRVITVEEARELGAAIIVIVARPGNAKLIFRRISGSCAKHNILVYTINGNIMSESENKNFSGRYCDIREALLQEKIRMADVVSFDIFDTLLMRKCLYPRDIFYIIGEEFAKKRIKAEVELYAQGLCPDIFDIYKHMDGNFSLQKEIDTESEYLLPREKMADMLNYARSLGKDIWLVSDMYLPGDILSGLLKQLGVFVEPERIIVSCDAGVSKSDGLFKVLRSKVGEAKILHIGDVFELDIQCALRDGIDDTFHVKSALAMLEDSRARGLLKYDAKLPNRLIIGEFISKQLNDPFLFNVTSGKFMIDSAYSMAYSFIAPVIYSFFCWMVEKARELKLDVILLGARDGFIMEKLYDCLRDDLDLPGMIYFYTSRAVAVIAGLFTDEDILHTASFAFSGTLEEMLRKRFHVVPMPRECESDEEYMLRHRGQILNAAKAVRDNYLLYIDGFSLGKKIGFFDLIASGSCQRAIEKFVDFNMTGLYLAQIETGNKPGPRIESLFGRIDTLREHYYIQSRQFLLEAVMTSYEPMLAGFDAEGKPLFLQEYRTEAHLAQLEEMHRAITDGVAYKTNVGRGQGSVGLYSGN